MARSLLARLADYVRGELKEYLDDSDEPQVASVRETPLEALLAETRDRLGDVTASLHRTGLAITDCQAKLAELGGSVQGVIERGREDLAEAVFEERQALTGRLADLRAERSGLDEQQVALNNILREFASDRGRAEAGAADRAARLQEFLELARKSEQGDDSQDDPGG